MKELLFRVWNGIEYEYDVMVGKFGVFYVNPINDGLDVEDSASLSPFNTKFSDDIVVEQFTGVLDRVKNKLFEGDIVLAKGKKSIGDYVTTIVFRDGAFVLKENKTYFTDSSALSTSLRLGTIFENPELLEENI